MIQRKLRLPAPGKETFFLWGPRQTGKSTLLKSTYPDAVWIDLLKAEAFRRYLNHPELLRQERLIVVESLDVAEPKTKALVEKLGELDFGKGLIVTSDDSENVYLASRNIPGVYTVDVAAIDPVSLVAADKVILTVGAVEKIQEWLG